MALGSAELLVIGIILVIGAAVLVVTILGLVRSAQRGDWGWFAAMVVGFLIGLVGAIVALVYLVRTRDAAPVLAPGSTPSPASPPGWHADPHGEHELRYWDGATWTDQVSDGGVVSQAPVEG